MNQSFYTAAVGAAQQMERINVQANNIANVNTYGFKGEKPSFASLMNTTLIGIDEEELPIGVGAKMQQATTDFSSGAVYTTNRNMDYAINGDGFFALLDPSTGEVTYTRDGSFTESLYTQQGEDGTVETVTYLSDGDGRFVLSTLGQVIQIEDHELTQEIGVFDFMNTDGMLHMGDNRFAPVEKNGDVRMGTGTLIQGALEGSNVDLANELSKLIESQRSYSYALRMVQTSDEIESTVNSLRG